jgi:pimeloyl-ACP methyl ester carboxylesterase
MSIWIELLGCEVRFRGNYRTRTIEAGTGRPLSLIHGVGGHAEAYARNVRRLGTQHHAMAIDLLWHGLSGKPPFTTEMVPAYCEQLLDLLDAVGADKASIEGESLGGLVAMQFALRHPDRVDKIVLNTTSGIRLDEAAVPVDRERGANQLRERSLAAIRDPNPATIRKRLEWLMASPDRVTDELVALRCAMYSLPETRASLTNIFENSFGGPSSRYHLSEAELAGIGVPTLVLWSDQNPGTGPAVGRRIATLIPAARYACIDAAAHWPQWEQPEEHDRIVLEFLAS